MQAVALPEEAETYLCGPARFMADMKEALLATGIAASRIHAELFQGSEAMTPGVINAAVRVPHVPAEDRSAGPVISFARSGVAAHWDPSKYQNLLELAEACDVPVRWSCRTGVCHSCESGLVSGRVIYAPEPLDMPAEGNLLLCCAQPVSDAALDI
jgi:ferredoxin